MASNTRTRRSTRIVSRDASLYKDGSDSEESDVAANDSDDEYVGPSETNRKRTKGSQNIQKKRKKALGLTAKSVQDLSPDFEENTLYQALSKPDISTQDLALEWLEEYAEQEENNKDSNLIASLVNLLLRSCGCIYLLQPHDIVNLESSAETVGEVTIAFEKQRYHEYPFISNNKDLKFFRKNVCDFFEDLIYLAHEKGQLYVASNDNDLNQDDEREEVLSSPLMSKILTWLTSLGSCSVRPLRYISTTILLTIQTKLCDIAVNVTTTLEKYQRQLSNVTSKNKGGKKSRSNKADTITRNIHIYHNQRETIYEYFGEICETTFIHRYRDVDHLIRQECIKHLGQWMLTFPEYFFQSSYLRYFGWLLSDPSNHVRAEVTRVLLKLYKNASNGNLNISIGFRQFTERFKKQLINMGRKDSDYGVRHNLISICCELLKIGFLEESDNLQICQSYFYLLDYGSGFGHSSDEKLKIELCKFINYVNSESTKSEMEKYSIFMKNYESPQFGSEAGKLDINQCLMIKNLIQFLKTSYEYYLQNSDSRDFKSPRVKNCTPIATVYKTLYSLPSYANTWEFLVRYLLFDLSSITFHGTLEDIEEENVEVSSFKQLIELSDDCDERYYLLNFINGSISSILNSRNKRNKEESELEENPKSVMIKLINYLPSLQKVLDKSNELFLIFLDLWNELISSSPNHDNIYTIFQNMGQLSVYNDITTKIIGKYQSYEFDKSDGDSLSQVFDEYFSKLLFNYENHISTFQVVDNNTQSNIMNTDVRLKVQNLLEELVAEVRDTFNSNISEIAFINDNANNDELETQKAIFNSLSMGSKPLIKLGKLGNYININEYTNNSSTKSSSIVELLLTRVLNRIDIKKMTENWPNIFLQILDTFIESYKGVLDYILVCNSWKLEELISLPSSNHQDSQQDYDVELIFKDLSSILDSNARIFQSFFDANLYFHERVETSSSNLSSENTFVLIEKLNNLKTLVGAKIIDIIVSMKVFFIKFNGQNNFKNFDKFFDEYDVINKFINNHIPARFQDQLLNIFLCKESKLANLTGIELDKTNEEDVNIGEFYKSNLEKDSVNRSAFDSDDNDSGLELNDDETDETDIKESKLKLTELKYQQKKENNRWNAEKDLCVFVVKLFTLIHLSMVDDLILDRLKLNSDKIGGLYQNLLKLNVDQLNKLRDRANMNFTKENSSTAEGESTPSTTATHFSDVEFGTEVGESEGISHT